MNSIKQFLGRWKNDFDFKTLTASFNSLAVTVLFALYNGFLGVYHASLWHGTICVYYLILSALRGLIVLSERRIAGSAREAEARRRVYVISAVLLFILNVSLVVPVSLLVLLQKPVALSLIPAIAMATYTTYKIVMASVNLKRRTRSENRLVRLLRMINFIDALVSILTLQNTLIMVNMKDESNRMLSLTAVTSAAIMLAVLALSIAALRKGIMSLKRKE
ncbi:MAG: hypothetical protein IKP19_04555 [Oscillospiraceae bacterium]|nr:hypothetical protein [Oscillospiraceae bacterium]